MAAGSCVATYATMGQLLFTPWAWAYSARSITPCLWLNPTFKPSPCVHLLQVQSSPMTKMRSSARMAFYYRDIHYYITPSQPLPTVWLHASWAWLIKIWPRSQIFLRCVRADVYSKFWPTARHQNELQSNQPCFETGIWWRPAYEFIITRKLIFQKPSSTFRGKSIWETDNSDNIPDRQLFSHFVNYSKVSV